MLSLNVQAQQFPIPQTAAEVPGPAPGPMTEAYLTLDRIRKGTQDATVGKDLNGMVGIVLNQIIAYFEGKPFAEKGQTKPILITKDNVDDPNLWGNSFR
jgi:hypothetical protein